MNINFQLKLSDTPVTLKYNQGHCMKYEWVQLNEYYRHAKFYFYIIHSVWENLNVKVFLPYTNNLLASPTWVITYSHFSCVSNNNKFYLFFCLSQQCKITSKNSA